MDAPKIEKWNDLVLQLKKLSAWGIHFTPAENAAQVSSCLDKGWSLEGHYFGADKLNATLSDADYYASLFTSVTGGKYFSNSFSYAGGKLRPVSDMHLFIATSVTPDYLMNRYKLPVITKYGPSFDVGRNLHPQIFSFSQVVLPLHEMQCLERNLDACGGRKYTAVGPSDDHLFDDTLETEIDLEVLRRVQSSLLKK